MGRVDSPQPCLSCLWGRQCRRIAFSDGRAVALSHARIRTHRAASGAYRSWFTVRAHCVCSLGFGDVPARVQRTKDQLLGDGGFGGGGDCHALACQREAEFINSDEKRRSQGRCCRERLVRLPFNHRANRARASRPLAHCMGRPSSSIADYSPHCTRGSGSLARQVLWLLLGQGSARKPIRGR